MENIEMRALANTQNYERGKDFHVQLCLCKKDHSMVEEFSVHQCPIVWYSRRKEVQEICFVAVEWFSESNLPLDENWAELVSKLSWEKGEARSIVRHQPPAILKINKKRSEIGIESMFIKLHLYYHGVVVTSNEVKIPWKQHKRSRGANMDLLPSTSHLINLLPYHTPQHTGNSLSLPMPTPSLNTLPSNSPFLHTSTTSNHQKSPSLSSFIPFNLPSISNLPLPTSGQSVDTTDFSAFIFEMSCNEITILEKESIGTALVRQSKSQPTSLILCIVTKETTIDRWEILENVLYVGLNNIILQFPNLIALMATDRRIFPKESLPFQQTQVLHLEIEDHNTLRQVLKNQGSSSMKTVLLKYCSLQPKQRLITMDRNNTPRGYCKNCGETDCPQYNSADGYDCQICHHNAAQHINLLITQPQIKWQ